MTQEPALDSVNAFAVRHAQLIGSAYAEVNAARWGLSPESFAAALGKSVRKRFPSGRAGALEIETYVKSLHLGDLALACACAEGLDCGWEYFVANYRQALYGAAAAILRTAHGSDARQARDLADSIYAELYGLRSADGADRKSLFEYFHGRSRLSTWLSAVLAQRHVDQIRTSKRMVSLDTEEEVRPVAGGLHDTAPPPPDPDRALYLALLDAALSEALRDLPARERLLLTYYYFDQRTLREIGQVFGEHESTISRQLDRIRSYLREAVTNALLSGKPALDGQPTRPGLSQAQLKLAFESALDDRPFDLSRVLSKGLAAVDKKD